LDPGHWPPDPTTDVLTHEDAEGAVDDFDPDQGETMRLISRHEQARISEEGPRPDGLDVAWFEGPFVGDRLDVGLARVRGGVTTPPHAHRGGQVLIAIAGQGFVECDGERLEMSPGDVVICSPGELHLHGASGDEPFSHLTVTTGPHVLP
jgi:quercetin dioxygenase-like cupin family protein